MSRKVSQNITPSTASMLNGALKDTPANRALTPDTTPQETFQQPDLLQDAMYSDAKTLIFCGDAKEKLEFLVKQRIKVDCIVTSPPFYGQRDYGVDRQIGLEEHPKEYICKLVEVFGFCWDLLRDTGSLWVNLGDTYWSGKGAHRSVEAKQSARRFGVRPQDLPGDGSWTRPKQLLLIPHRFAIAMQDSGWLVRNDNVWVKPNPVPDQVRDRCSISHEYMFHFTKSRWYYFNRIPVGRSTGTGSILPPLDTWLVPPAKGNGSHKAQFSEDLLRIPILATTPPDGIVLDPFNGSGTSTLYARKQGFRSIGVDIHTGYCSEAADLLGGIDADSRMPE